MDNFTTKVMELSNHSKFLKGLMLDAYENVALLTKRIASQIFQENKNIVLGLLRVYLVFNLNLVL